METLLLIVAFWLILLGVYGTIFLSHGEGPLLTSSPTRPRLNVRRDPFPVVTPERARNAFQATVEGIRPRSVTVSEVELLRAQVEQLRCEIVALSGAPAVSQERYRPRRHIAGAPAQLPRPLRRQVREVRAYGPLHARV